MSLEIRPLTPELKEDYLSFFESIEFKEHPHWTNCYCYSFHFTGKANDWQKESNRACVSDMIDEGSMKGYLAYHQDSVIGWANANNRLNYQLLTKAYDLIDPGQKNICSIVCFLVHQDFRRQGIMQLLLSRIVADYSALHYEFIEAYPQADEPSTEKLYRGPMEFYSRNGFELIRPGDAYHTVRRKL